MTVDLGAVPGGKGCRLRVIYSDGVQTTTVVSPQLDVEARPADPVIEAAAADHRTLANGWLSLRVGSTATAIPTSWNGFSTKRRSGADPGADMPAQELASTP